MKLALGTVQFGLDYGIANRNGQVSEAEIAAILQAARDAGIDTLDTAIAYGDSETRLGHAGVAAFNVVSKLPALGDDVSGIASAITQSLERLRVPRLYGLLLHRSQDLTGLYGDAVFAALMDAKSRGLVHKIGVSIYDPAELETILSRYALDLVQAPYNIFDRRIDQSGRLSRLKERGIEVHTRSAFLQGLLLMPTDRRPPHFTQWSALLARWDAWLVETGLTPLQAALGFACSHPVIDRVIVGVDNRAQLADIINDATTSIPPPPNDLATDDIGLINPANWTTP